MAPRVCAAGHYHSGQPGQRRPRQGPASRQSRRQEAAITLGALDPEGAPRFELVTLPEHGILRGRRTDLRAHAELSWLHSFTFRVNDGTQWSEAGTVHRAIQPSTMHPPARLPPAMSSPGSPSIDAGGWDVDEDERTVRWTPPPAKVNSPAPAPSRSTPQMMVFRGRLHRVYRRRRGRGVGPDPRQLLGQRSQRGARRARCIGDHERGYARRAHLGRRRSRR